MSREKLHDGAASHIEPDERICESVLVRSGTLRQQNHALVATDRNLYAFRLTWPGFSKVAETLLKIPIGQARTEVSRRAVCVTDQRTGESRRWKRLKRRDPQPLAEHVSSHQAGSG